MVIQVTYPLNQILSKTRSEDVETVSVCLRRFPGIPCTIGEVTPGAPHTMGIGPSLLKGLLFRIDVYNQHFIHDRSMCINDNKRVKMLFQQVLLKQHFPLFGSKFARSAKSVLAAFWSPTLCISDLSSIVTIDNSWKAAEFQMLLVWSCPKEGLLGGEVHCQ